MSGLNSFFRQNAVSVEHVKYMVSPRFLDEKKKPIRWELCCITSEEDEEIRKACSKRVPVPGKKNQFIRETDGPLYLGKLAAKCTLYPNLNDKELQDSYKAMGAESLLKSMLTPGEYNDYLVKVQEVNGFDVSMEELAEEAKN